MNRKKGRQVKKTYNPSSIFSEGDRLLAASLALYESGNHNDAIVKLTGAFSSNKKHPQIGSALAVLLHQAGRSDRALKVFQTYLKNNPENGEAWLNYGLTHRELGHLNEALVALTKATQLLPDNFSAWFNRSGLFIDLKKYDESLADLKYCTSLNPTSAELWCRLAFVLKEIKDFEGAIEAYKKATKLLPKDPELWNQLGFLFSVKGYKKQAMKCYTRATQLNPEYPSVYLNIAKAGALKKGGTLFENAKSISRNLDISPLDRASIAFALGLALDFSQEFDEAFEHFKSANLLMRNIVNYNEEAELRKIDHIISYFKDKRPTKGTYPDVDEVTLIFVLGMPRSGTSLVEQILASHPSVYGAGELGALGIVASELNYPESFFDLPNNYILSAREKYLDYVKKYSKEYQYVIDKEPRNFLLIGLILQLFPNAKIIHCKRNPLDTCLSCYMQQFNTGVGFSFSLEETARYYKKYTELMTVWNSIYPKNIFQLHYEELIDDAQKKVRQLAAYCDLSWEESMLEYYKNDRAVFTASKDQVRLPIYNSSVNRWKAYESHLTPLINEFQKTIFSRSLK